MTPFDPPQDRGGRLLRALSGLLVVGLIVFMVVPQFADFYDDFGSGAELPMSTQIVVAISESLAQSALLIFGTLAVLITTLVLWLRKPSARRWMHRTILRLPYFGPLARKLATAQVSRTLATLLSGGIPLVNALDVGAKSVSNLAIADGLGTDPG